MAFITIEDLYGTLEVIVFPNQLVRYKELIRIDKIILLDGQLSIKEDEEPKIICNKINYIYKIIEDKKNRN